MEPYDILVPITMSHPVVYSTGQSHQGRDAEGRPSRHEIQECVIPVDRANESGDSFAIEPACSSPPHLHHFIYESTLPKYSTSEIDGCSAGMSIRVQNS